MALFSWFKSSFGERVFSRGHVVLSDKIFFSNFSFSHFSNKISVVFTFYFDITVDKNNDSIIYIEKIVKNY